MRFSIFLPVVFVGLAAAACSSSGGSGPSGSPDGASPDGATSDGPTSDGTMAGDTAAPSCGNIAACYSVTLTLDPRSATGCSTMGTQVAGVADYSSVTGDGNFTIGGCQGVLSGCVMMQLCQGTQQWNFTFGNNGFTGTIVDQTLGCQATAVGTRLASCPVSEAGGGEGGEGDGAPGDASQESGTVEGGVDNPEASVEAGVAEAGAEAAAAEGGADAATEASEGSSDAGVSDASDAGTATDAGDGSAALEGGGGDI
jgi:hypothetical protein